MDELTTTLARLSRQAQLCAESLSCAAAAASDPQVRAVLAHRANMQRCAAAELAVRASAAIDSGDTIPTARKREPVAMHAAPPTEAGELVLLRYAAQQAARAAASYGALLREPLSDPDLRLLLAHYYRGATELERLLEHRVAEFAPARAGTISARRASPSVH